MPPKASGSPPLVQLVKKVASSGTALNAKLAGDNLARGVLKYGLAMAVDQGILKSLSDYASSSKAAERMAATVAFLSLINVVGPPLLPFLLVRSPVLLNLLGEDDDVIRNNATKAFQALVGLVPVEGLVQVVDLIGTELKTTTKWRCKVGCLKELARLVDSKPPESQEEIASMLAVLLPIVEHAMHDTKKEVRQDE